MGVCLFLQLCDGSIVAFTVLHNVNCNHGFIYVTSQVRLEHVFIWLFLSMLWDEAMALWLIIILNFKFSGHFKDLPIAIWINL